MTIEATTTISGLVQTYPDPNDPVKEGDDHLRLLKQVLKDQFTGNTTGINRGLAGPVTATHTELNYVKGVTSAIQTQLNNLLAVIVNMQSQLYAPDNTQMLFYQSAAPAGWVIETEATNSMIVLSPFGGGLTGGSMDPVNLPATHIHTTAAVALTIAQMPAHTHTTTIPLSGGNQGGGGVASGNPSATNTGSQGSGATHTHGNTGSTAITLTPYFRSVIRCRKT